MPRIHILRELTGVDEHQMRKALIVDKNGKLIIDDKKEITLEVLSEKSTDIKEVSISETPGLYTEPVQEIKRVKKNFPFRKKKVSEED